MEEQQLDLYDLAERQYGVFSRDQAQRLDVTSDSLRRLTGSGRIERTGPEVFRLRGVPPTWHQRLMSATLTLPGALASHRAAAALHGLRGFEAVPVEVVVERWRRHELRRLGVVVHETKDLVAGDIGEQAGIPCTTLVRTLVDLPAVVSEPRAGDALDHAARRSSGILVRVHARHLEVARRGRNGTVKLRALLEERGVGDHKVDSGFERKALQLIASSSLPRPVTQHQVRDGDFVAYLDIAWPERRVAVECDSLEHHLGERAFRWERKRRRRLAALGWTILEYTYREVTQEGGMVLRELRQHLG